MSQPSCKTRNRVDQKLQHKEAGSPGHGKEKESGQKVKEELGKRGSKVILHETGWLVRAESGTFYIRLWLSEY